MGSFFTSEWVLIRLPLTIAAVIGIVVSLLPDVTGIHSSGSVYRTSLAGAVVKDVTRVWDLPELARSFTNYLELRLLYSHYCDLGLFLVMVVSASRRVAFPYLTMLFSVFVFRLYIGRLFNDSLELHATILWAIALAFGCFCGAETKRPAKREILGLEKVLRVVLVLHGMALIGLVAYPYLQYSEEQWSLDLPFQAYKALPTEAVQLVNSIVLQVGSSELVFGVSMMLMGLVGRGVSLNLFVAFVGLTVTRGFLQFLNNESFGLLKAVYTAFTDESARAIIFQQLQFLKYMRNIYSILAIVYAGGAIVLFPVLLFS